MSSNVETFQDRHLSFQLFAAPISHAVTDEAGQCAFCGKDSSIRFEQACYECFRADRVDTAIATELGMVTKGEAARGRTHGLPITCPEDFGEYELTAHPIDLGFPDENWFHVHVQPEFLFELIRTPKHHSWQGEYWLFCCHRPMVFQGIVATELVTCPEDERLEVLSTLTSTPNWAAKSDWEHSPHAFNVFTCGQCNTLRFHDDCS